MGLRHPVVACLYFVLEHLFFFHPCVVVCSLNLHPVRGIVFFLFLCLRCVCVYMRVHWSTLFGQMYRTLFSVYKCFFSVYRALLSVYRALLSA